MTRLAPPQIATMTKLREPRNVLDRANGHPVAVLKNSALVACLVPAEAVGKADHCYATLEEVMERTRAAAQPVLN